MVGKIGRKRVWWALAAVVIALSLAGLALRGKESSPAAGISAAASQTGSTVVSAPGRVEPLSEDVRLGSELDGKLAKVLVDEGDIVRKGQVLAILVNDDYSAQVASQVATLAEKEADERKTRNGARTEERREAQAAADAELAILENAREDMERYQSLYKGGAVSREEADHYLREYKVALAQYDQARQHFTLLDEDTREEDQARAAADVALAQAQLDASRARYEKTFIRAPIDGVILRRYHRAGENVTNSSNGSDPIFTLGSRGVLRVRADVDETDIARIHLGDRVYVTADAFGGRKFWGRVVRLGGEMGKKNIYTDEPTERVDTKILETLVDLDDGHELPVGLRVDTFILSNP